MTKRKHARPSLEATDMSRTIGRSAYESELGDLQLTLARIQQTFLFTGDKAVIVFEGWDAAGKGGAIRRLSAALDPRSFKVWSIGAPSSYYLERHHLLRFMERLPPKGAISAFDRSWYGRVLVERVEELTPKARWRAAFEEINDFEKMLANDGTRIVKLFMHITPDVQLERFEERLRNPLKRWKLTYEDFRNRAKWDLYVEAIEEMLERTSTDHAPWHVVPSNHKKWARIHALRLIRDRLGAGLELSALLPDGKVLDEAGKLMDIDPDLIASLRGRSD